MVPEGDGHLLEIVLALRRSRRFARRLNGGQQHRDKNAEERDDHQEFNKRERRMCSTASFAQLRKHYEK